MSARGALSAVRRVLAERSFTEEQIQNVLPRLHPGHMEQPELLAETIDTWNSSMRAGVLREQVDPDAARSIPATSSPPANSPLAKRRINMNTVLAEVEPDLLRFRPDKLIQRHNNINGLGIVQNLGEHWTVLFNAPRGFYLQDWFELIRKVYYIDNYVVDLLYDKKEQKEMQRHPLVWSSASIEADFDHIRTRYLFAKRTGFRELGHMRKAQTANDRPTLKDLILVDDEMFLENFAPFCSKEEYTCFANLIKNHELDEDDADICNRMAELQSLKHLDSTRGKSQPSVD